MPDEPPLIVLGVRRSGTTLLRVMLDRNPSLSVPDESYFVPQLARRHRGSVDPAAFLDDLRRLPTLVEWGLSADAVARRLRPGMTTGAAIAAVFEAYAAELGKARWGDKTPLYMQYLPLLEREMEMAASGLGAGSREVVQIHWGGGTPTFLPPRDLTGLMAAIRRHFRLAAEPEISVEIDPRVGGIPSTKGVL